MNFESSINRMYDAESDRESQTLSSLIFSRAFNTMTYFANGVESVLTLAVQRVTQKAETTFFLDPSRIV